MAVGDFDGDGNLDIAIAQQAFNSSSVDMALGNGDGSFRPFVHNLNLVTDPMDLIAVSSEGHSSLFVENYWEAAGGAFHPRLSAVGVQDGGSLAMTSSVLLDGSPGALSMADLNRDGIPDALVSVQADQGFGEIQVLLGNSDGGWTSRGELPAWSMPRDGFVDDFNEDGIPDAIARPMPDPNSPLHVWLGKGDGTFADKGSLGGSVDPQTTLTSLVMADLNGDGHRDVLVLEELFNSQLGSVQDAWTLFLGRGDGTFVAGPSVDFGSSFPVALRDLNGDGVPDYIGASAAGVRLAVGNGDGTFQSWSDFSMDAGVGNAVVGDVNNDGWPDVVVIGANSSYAISVLLNQCR
jgi:hypothetical protein